MSIEDYLHLDQSSLENRYEYVDGHIRMLAGGTPDHAKISANFIGVLYGLLEGRSCGSEEDVELASLGIHFPLSKIYRNVVFLEDGPD
jgi:Uma2 family endonuclease